MLWFELFLKTSFGFILLLFVTKVLGKTQIRQLTAFDFISALILGEFVGNALYDPETNLLQVMFALFIWGGLMMIIEIVTQKYKGTRHFLEGKPDIIIENGKIDREMMKRNRLDFNQLQHLLRMKDVFQIKDVNVAILETDGTISVLKKSDPIKVLPVNLINDGEIIYNNLRVLGKDDIWLKRTLKQQGITDYENIFSCEYTKNEPLAIQWR
ncbi:DUF421 domain-containing protein [Halolactibacillus miurensis]|uniref:DUF421 domain-containing protein n=1 Tax=Halolactibacillus miurensis TaxID=306541 RepID=A0A1I6S2K1_9BACI|nr:DUF421 domain-containing protein [Halolactibacillus miurensis]GEM04957.1 DUF421 domain-containing protein [Halolactibacillus miurensis]SFS71144.1 Uncharacterized membrane protein YcaP, DUF421 family [Halolactibacillus miurensis]